MSATPRVACAVRQLPSRCLPKSASSSTRALYKCPFSTSAKSNQGEHEPYRPRWQQTPPSLRAPVRLRASRSNLPFTVNDDPKVLDDFYRRFLGSRPELVPSEEVRWIAITHKSFDQGARGYNARLAYMGKRIADLQTSLALLQPSHAVTPIPDPYGRTPFTHPALDQLDNLSPARKLEILSPTRIAPLAETYGLNHVVRWTPRMPDNLKESGIDSVLAQAMYAIIGAIALEHGGAAAKAVFDSQILKSLKI